MHITEIIIENFRAIKFQSIPILGVTAFVGANGAGKSTVLKALDLFYSTKSQNISADDFFGKDTSNPISITVVYTKFTDEERKEFHAKIKDDAMAVTRVFFYHGGERHGLYQTSSIQNKDFDKVRRAKKASDKKAAYTELMQQAKYTGQLERAASSDDIDAQLEGWEMSHPEECEMGLDGGKFFGLKTVAQNKLTQNNKWIYIPAVKDASSDVGAGKGSAIGQLVDLVVRSQFESRKEYQQFKLKFEEEYSKLTSAESNPGLVRLQEELSANLRSYYPMADVGLDWGFGTNLQLPPPVHNLSVSDEGFETSVDRMGHGLQRALVMALAQQLALTNGPLEDIDNEKKADGHKTHQTLIFAIEEPEIYQHPAKQRHFYRVLQNLAQKGVQGAGSSVQVLYTTHSPLLLSVDKFEEIRIVKREEVEGGLRQAILNHSNIMDVCETMKSAKKEDDEIDDSYIRKVRSTLHTMEGVVSEGFFSKSVVLVEGKSDKVILEVVANRLGVDLEARDISVISVSSKGNILKTASVFRTLGINVYLLWDGDNGDQTNEFLLRFSGVDDKDIDVVAECVSEKYACFKGNLEKKIASQVGGECYSAYKEKAYGIFDVNSSDAMKRPAVAKWIIDEAYNDGKSFPFIEEMVKNISHLV